MDITVAEAMATLCRGIHDRWGHVDVWAHTAIHATPLTPTAHIDAKDLARSIDANVTAAQRLIAYVEPLLKAAPAGRALFFDDPRAGQKFFGTYGATKAAQMALAASWQAEGVKIGPRVDILTPAPMPTALRGRFFPGEDRARLALPADEARRLLTGAGLL
jgi:NAD(P)-dependent dehydrogenase (short-subunit alcohol dehydrogenase family)